MKNLAQLFIEHPHEVGESYWSHQRYAAWVALRISWVALMLCIHAIFPFLYTTAASRGLIKLSEEIRVRSQEDEKHD